MAMDFKNLILHLSQQFQLFDLVLQIDDLLFSVTLIIHLEQGHQILYLTMNEELKGKRGNNA